MGASFSSAPPLSRADIRRATCRCETHSRAYAACCAASAGNAAAEVSASFSSSPTSQPSACAPLRDSLTHCLCEAAGLAIAESYAACAIAAAGRGDYSGHACVRERDLMVRALRAAGLAPALDSPPPPPARHVRARAARAAAAAAAGSGTA